MGVENHEGYRPLRQVIPDRQASLPAADHHRLDLIRQLSACHAAPLLAIREFTLDQRGARPKPDR
jgi:hypothetical protein